MQGTPGLPGCAGSHTAETTRTWSQAAFWLLMFWGHLTAFLAGNALASAGECNAGWVWNPFQYIKLLSSLHASPWACSSPQLAAVMHESRVEILGGIAAVVGSTAAMVWGGAPAGAFALSVVSELTGASTAQKLASAVSAAGGHGTMDLSHKLVDEPTKQYVPTEAPQPFSGKGVKLGTTTKW